MSSRLGRPAGGADRYQVRPAARAFGKSMASRHLRCLAGPILGQAQFPRHPAGTGAHQEASAQAGGRRDQPPHLYFHGAPGLTPHDQARSVLKIFAVGLERLGALGPRASTAMAARPGGPKGLQRFAPSSCWTRSLVAPQSPARQSRNCFLRSPWTADACSLGVTKREPLAQRILPPPATMKAPS